MEFSSQAVESDFPDAIGVSTPDEPVEHLPCQHPSSEF